MYGVDGVSEKFVCVFLVFKAEMSGDFYRGKKEVLEWGEEFMFFFLTIYYCSFIIIFGGFRENRVFRKVVSEDKCFV